MKYLWINLTNIYKTCSLKITILLIKIKEDLNKWKRYTLLIGQKTRIFKMLILYELIYRFKAILGTKIPREFLVETDKLILNLHENAKDL